MLLVIDCWGAVAMVEHMTGDAGISGGMPWGWESGGMFVALGSTSTDVEPFSRV